MSEHTRFEDLISEKLDGVITADDERALAAHLASCPDCRELMAVLSAAHGALDFEAEPPEELKTNVMEAVRAEKNRKKIRLRTLAGALAAAAVLAAAILPAALPRLMRDEDLGIATASLTRENDIPVGEDPTEYAGGVPTGFCLTRPDDPDTPLTVEDYCAAYAAVAWFDALPEEIASAAQPVSFSNGDLGYEVTEAQFRQLLPTAQRVIYPSPAGAQYMAILAADSE